MKKSFCSGITPARSHHRAKLKKYSDKRNRFFRAIRFVIVFDFDELQKHKQPLLQAGI
jgi:hypothetical protein